MHGKAMNEGCLVCKFDRATVADQNKVKPKANRRFECMGVFCEWEGSSGYGGDQTKLGRAKEIFVGQSGGLVSGRTRFSRAQYG